MDHTPDCRWERTTEAECEYRATHHYCPHPEHACNCAASETPVDVPKDLPTRAQAIAIMGKWPSTSSEVNELVMKLYTQLERAAVLQRAPASTTTTRDWTLHIKWLRDLASPRNWDKDSPERLTVLEVADFLAGVQGTERAARCLSSAMATALLMASIGLSPTASAKSRPPFWQ